MPEPRFTKGPWKVITPPIVVVNERQTHSVDGPECDFMYLANVEDAHLIAAAPDLYNALDKLFWRFGWVFENSKYVNDGDDQQAINDARAAMAKARGEAS